MYTHKHINIIKILDIRTNLRKKCNLMDSLLTKYMSLWTEINQIVFRIMFKDNTIFVVLCANV